MSFFSDFVRRFKSSEKVLDGVKDARTKNVDASNKIGKKTALVQDGVAIIAAAALLVFSAAARGVNLLLALGAFFIGFLVVDYVWGARTLKKLHVKRRLPDSIYAGEPFYVEIEIDGTRRRSPSWAIVVEDEWSPEDPCFDVPAPLKSRAQERAEAEMNATLIHGKKRKNKKRRRPGKRVSDKADEALQNKDSLELPQIGYSAISRGDATIRPVVYFPTVRTTEKLKEYYVGVMMRRGRRQLVALTVSTRFPCGFYRSSRRVPAREDVLVLPRTGVLTSDWDAYAGSLTQETSVATSLTSRAPDETVAIRDWRPGDSSRTIAWRATAKRNKLQTREFAKRQTRTIVIVLDLYAPSATRDRKTPCDPALWERVEKAVSFTATLVKEWSTSDSRLVFTLNADEIGAETNVNDGLEGNNESQSEWNEIFGGGSTLRVMSRLAVAVETNNDRLGELLNATRSHAPKDAQIIVVSLGYKREATDAISVKDLEEVSSWTYGSFLQPDNVHFIDASSEDFDRYFQFGPDADELGSIRS